MDSDVLINEREWMLHCIVYRTSTRNEFYLWGLFFRRARVGAQGKAGFRHFSKTK